jgi:chondroitin sulfate proteoglycan 4
MSRNFMDIYMARRVNDGHRCCLVSASFYGASYISVPLQDAKSTTELHFKFRTKRPDAMLFLAAGRTDYCLVRLEAGRLKVRTYVSLPL